MFFHGIFDLHVKLIQSKQVEEDNFTKYMYYFNLIWPCHIFLAETYFNNAEYKLRKECVGNMTFFS